MAGKNVRTARKTRATATLPIWIGLELNLVHCLTYRPVLEVHWPSISSYPYVILRKTESCYSNKNKLMYQWREDVIRVECHIRTYCQYMKN